MCLVQLGDASHSHVLRRECKYTSRGGEVHVTGPAELLSMYLRLLGDEDCYRVSAGWVEKHTKTISAAATQYLQSHGQNAHPAILLQAARAAATAAQ